MARRRTDSGSAVPYAVAAAVLAVLALLFGVLAVSMLGDRDARADSIADAAADATDAIISGVATIDTAARQYRGRTTIDTSAMLDALQEADESVTALALPDDEVTGTTAASIRAAVDAHRAFLTAMGDFASVPELATAEGAAVVAATIDALETAVRRVGAGTLRPDQVESVRTFLGDVVDRARASSDETAAAAQAFRDALAAAAAIDADRDAMLAAVAAATAAIDDLITSWPVLDEPLRQRALGPAQNRHDTAIAILDNQLAALESIAVDRAFSAEHTLVINDVTALRREARRSIQVLFEIACADPPPSTTTTTQPTTTSSTNPGDLQSPTSSSTTSTSTTTTQPCPELGTVEAWTSQREAVARVRNALDASVAAWNDEYVDAIRAVFP